MAGWRSAEELIGWGSRASSASAWARIIEPIGGPAFSLDEAYTAKITVPAGALSEENPGDPTQSGTYKIVMTTSDMSPDLVEVR
jgi:hypothetical protein